MLRTVAGTLGALALVATTALTATPARAAGTLTVTSPSCGTVRITNGLSSTMVVGLDSGDEITVQAGRSTTLRTESGAYTWISGPLGSEWAMTAHRLTVKGCTGWPARPVEGDQNGDGRADVLGIQAGTGDLYYYRMTGTGLAGGVKAGSGWNSMVFMQQVNEIEGSGTPNRLLAVRSDGTLWRYDNLGYGKFANGRQIGSGLSGYTNFAITSTIDPLYFGGHLLLARKGDMLYGFELRDGSLGAPHPVEDPDWSGVHWGTTTRLIATRDFDNDSFGDLVSIRTGGSMWLTPHGDGTETAFGKPRQIGSGWGAMQTVTSPGSLNGDALPDLVARRSDGNLYKYVNAGGRWNAAVQIGRNWQAIRLLA